LYVGSSPAARAHPGGASNHIVAYIIGHPDLSETPIFWGPDVLPERVTQEMGQQYEDTLAGKPPDKAIIAPLTQATLSLTNEAALYAHIATLIDQYAPEDKIFSQGIRVTKGQ